MSKHLKCLGLTTSSSIISNPNSISNFLHKLILEPLDMQILEMSKIIEVPLEIEKLGRHPFEDEGGITGQIIGYATLSTSHVAIHTWPLRHEFHLDIYSCKEFNKDKVKKFIKNHLDIKQLQVTDCSRGCEWKK